MNGITSILTKDLNKFLEDLNKLANLKTFFEIEKVSERHQEITLAYLISIKLEGRKEATLKNNIMIIKFILSRVVRI